MARVRGLSFLVSKTSNGPRQPIGGRNARHPASRGLARCKYGSLIRLFFPCSDPWERLRDAVLIVLSWIA